MTASATPDLASFIKEQRAGKDSKPTLPLNKEGAWAAVGFAVVLIVLGLPVWWRTTTVYRAPLPYAAVHELAPLRRQHFLPVTIFAEKHADGSLFSSQLDKYLKKAGPVRYHVSSRGLLKKQEVVVHEATTLSELVSRFCDDTVQHTATLSLLLLTEDRAHHLLHNAHVHVTRTNLLVVSVNADMAVVSDLIRSMTLDQSTEAESSVAAVRVPQDTRRQQPAPHKVVSEASYSLTVTLMLPQPHLTLAYWDSRAAVQAYLSPLLQQLESIEMRVSVRCQQLYMTPLSGVRPQWRADLQHYALPHHHLPLAINAIEAKLGSFVSTDPALHFIVYVPSKDQTPLHIHDPTDTPLPANSFVVPRWGGVIIHNPPAAAEVANSSGSGGGGALLRFPLDSHTVMTTILSQLHVLLPLPQITPTSLVSVAAAESPELAQWQLDALARARVTQYYQTTSTTLQSLHELVGEISNMVVSEEVGSWVWQSVDEWVACGEATQEGRLQEASLYCTAAHANAHAAFFHPSMLALLYFPDNQKYAIYVPLFLPVSIPVLLSFRMLYTLVKSYCTKQPVST